jgi:hypothetical protein
MWLEINICNTNTQHGMKGFKIVEAKQASIMNRYLNIKRKLLITNDNIWFNKQALSAFWI